MAFKILSDNLGMLYVPECKPGKKKHPCHDCFSCQWCGNERCRVCIGKTLKIQKHRKSSLKSK
jgi:hypothetical protein